MVPRKKSLGIEDVLPCHNIWLNRILGEDYISERIEVDQSFRKKSAKGLLWACTIHDKDPRSSQEFEAYCNKHGRDATVSVGDRRNAYQGLFTK